MNILILTALNICKSVPDVAAKGRHAYVEPRRLAIASVTASVRQLLALTFVQYLKIRFSYVLAYSLPGKNTVRLQIRKGAHELQVAKVQYS